VFHGRRCGRGGASCRSIFRRALQLAARNLAVNVRSGSLAPVADVFTNPRLRDQGVVTTCSTAAIGAAASQVPRARLQGHHLPRSAAATRREADHPSAAGEEPELFEQIVAGRH
jgi:hypothetical protein